MSGLLFGPQKSGRNNGVVVLTGWSYGGVPLYCKSLQAFYAAGCWGLCSSFLYNMSHDWKKYNQSQLGKGKKRPSSIYLAAKQLPSRVFTLKMDKFVLKVKPKKKPCSITPQERAKQYRRKFHADNSLNRHWRLHSSAKLQLTKRKWKSAMSGRNEKYVWCNKSLLLIIFVLICFISIINMWLYLTHPRKNHSSISQ